VAHLLNAVSEPVLQRAFQYWRNVDKNLGDKIEPGVRAQQGWQDPRRTQGDPPARMRRPGPRPAAAPVRHLRPGRGCRTITLSRGWRSGPVGRAFSH
jgi:hypothetical protein